jgi:hypothetical protein
VLESTAKRNPLIDEKDAWERGSKHGWQDFTS